MGLFPNVLDEARAKGIDHCAQIYSWRSFLTSGAVEKNQVVFHDVAAIEVKPHVKKNSGSGGLTDFSVSIRRIPSPLPKARSKTIPARSWRRKARS